MRVLLSGRGSLGDVRPIITIAAALRARGHEPVLCLPPLFVEAARLEGLRAIAHSEDSRDVMAGFGRDWRAVRTALTWLSRSVDEQFDYLLDHSADADMVVASTNELAAPSVAEHRRIPYVRVAYAPMVTSYRSNALLPWQGLPGWCNRLGWSLLNGVVEVLAGGTIQRRRNALGLPRIRQVGDYVARYGQTLFAMSDTLSPPCPSWRGRYRYDYTGYCFPPAGAALPEPLRRFLEQGPPPLYVGFGSVQVPDPEGTARIVRDAVVRAGCRALISSGWTRLGLTTPCSSVLVVGELDHQALFPLLGGVVHHGGSGTTHTAARAGVPQLVLPQVADQYYWGHRVSSLGLGPAPIPVSQLSVGRLAEAIARLVREPSYALRAAQIGRIVRAEPGTSGAVDVIEAAGGASAGRSTATGGRTEPLVA
jgi:UDP:flavonoid glycosyltransferase YjiC (YdhE family)